MKWFGSVRIVAACAVLGLSASGCVFIGTVDVSPTGVANGHANGASPSVSMDGRYVAFQSGATNFGGPEQQVPANDVFVRDMASKTVTRVSVSNMPGVAADKASSAPVISGDGRYVAFVSDATNIVAGDNNSRPDVFRRNLVNNTTQLVDVSSTGALHALGKSGGTSKLAISHEGRYIAFSTTTNGLVAGDTNSGTDVYVRDMNAVSNANRWLSVGNGLHGGVDPALSSTGRFVAFTSGSALVAADTNSSEDVYRVDLQATLPTPTLVSLTNQGGLGNAGSGFSDISGDGHHVVFASLASNLVANDTNGGRDHFVRNLDVANPTTVRVNVGTGVPGAQAAGGPQCYFAAISNDGRYVAFDSTAANIVTPDTNSVPDVFVRDTVRNTTTRVNEDQNGAPSTGGFSGCAAISRDGRYVGFLSIARNLTPDTNDGTWHVFLKANPVPTFTNASPTTIPRGTTGTITVNGTHFTTATDGSGVTAYFGADIVITNTARAETQVTFTISVAANAATGPRTVTLYNAGNAWNRLAGATTPASPPFTVTIS